MGERTSKKIDYETIGITYGCTIIALLLICVRLWARRMRGERLMSFHDDIWMGFSVIPMLVRLGLVHMVLVYGTNAVDEEELLLLSPLDIERRELGSHLVLVSRIAYAAFLWCMKACILGFLARLMSGSPKYASVINVLGWSFILTFIGVVLSTLLECRPFLNYFQVVPSPGKQCTLALGQLYTMGTTNIITDIALIILPLPLIFRSSLPLIRKLQVVLLFGVGSFDIVITLIRMPIIMQSGAMQQSRTLWASIEILVACVVANAPILNNFVQEYRRKRALKRSGEMDSIHSLKNRKIPEGKSRAKKMADSLASKLELGERSDENLTDPERYVIEASTEVTQTVDRVPEEVVKKQKSKYYKGDFLGTQIWTDQIFPGPRSPNNSNGHHHTSSNNSIINERMSSRRQNQSMTTSEALTSMPRSPPPVVVRMTSRRPPPLYSRFPHDSDEEEGLADIEQDLYQRGTGQ